MIHPNMATTLGFVMTDAALSRAHLHRVLKRASDRTFNRISVDGDTSTNDSLIALASGALGGPAVPVRGQITDRFEKALTGVLEDVAKMIVSDGEGAERLVKVEVVGASSEKVATAVARTIATSQLVKTAIHGCDPNWGRILGAAGRAGVPVDSDLVTIHVGGVCVFRRGRPLSVEQEASAAMSSAEYKIRVRLGSGSASSHYWTCDLGHEYVRINAEYRT
jgi:glutamate N-acetyltransferase/amino-acid N-acetyltransferase